MSGLAATALFPLVIAIFYILIRKLSLLDQNGRLCVKTVSNQSDFGLFWLPLPDVLRWCVFCDHIEVTEFMSHLFSSRSYAPKSLQSWSLTDEGGGGGDASSHASEHWTFYPLSMTLVSPRGVHVPLSAKEMRLIVYLLARDPHPVQREDFIQLLGVDLTHVRRVDATIYRLRMKIQKVTGQDAPFKTLYGQGYQNDGMMVFGRLPDLK